MSLPCPGIRRWDEKRRVPLTAGPEPIEPWLSPEIGQLCFIVAHKQNLTTSHGDGTSRPSRPHGILTGSLTMCPFPMCSVDPPCLPQCLPAKQARMDFKIKLRHSHIASSSMGLWSTAQLDMEPRGC